MASANLSGISGSADETLRPASSSGSPQHLGSQENPPRKPPRKPPRRTRSPVDANVSLRSGEYDDDETLQALSPRPGTSEASPFRRSPTPSPPRQSPQERWEAREGEIHAIYEELRHGNDIGQLRAFVDERYYDAVRYEIVAEDLKEMIERYASPEQQQEAIENEFHPFVMLNIIRDLLERCRYNREQLKAEFQEKLEDWKSRFEREQKRQTLLQTHQRYYDVGRRPQGDEEHMREIARAVYTTLMQGMQRAFFPRMQALTPDPDRVHFAVEEWFRTTERVLEQREAELNSLIQRSEYIELRKMRQMAEIEKLGNEVADLKRVELVKGKELHRLRHKLQEYQDYIEAINEEYHNRKFGRGIEAAAREARAGEVSTPDIYATVQQSTPMPGRSFKKGFKKVFTKPAQRVRGLFGTPTGPVSPDTPGVRRADTSSEYYDAYSDPFEDSYGISDTPPGISSPSGRPSPLSQTFVLTSPRRVEPLFVNIDVEPSNLIDTENGECFVCDIKLDVQPGGLSPQLQQASSYEVDTSPDRSLEMSASPIVKGRYRGRRNVAPDITPTSTRRKRELFTPKGIFKRGQLNIRRIPGRHPISELPWSPTYLPEDARSPVTSLSSPLRWSDRSVSWEKQYENDYGSSRSPSPIIRGPTHRSPSPGDRLSSSSPMIKRPVYGYSSPSSDQSSSLGTSYRYQSPDSGRSSASPMIQGPGYSYRSPDSGRSSPSPMIQGPDYISRSTDSDHSSASPTFVERFGRYPSPVASPLFATPPSGYEPELEISGSPKRSPSPHFVRNQDPLNRRIQFGESSSYAPQTIGISQYGPSSHFASNEDPLNRRIQFGESSSYAPQTLGISQYVPASHFPSYEDPFNRRMQLGEMIEASRYAPQMSGTPERTSDSMDSERGYLESSMDSSLLNEARFFN